MKETKIKRRNGKGEKTKGEKMMQKMIQDVGIGSKVMGKIRKMGIHTRNKGKGKRCRKQVRQCNKGNDPGSMKWNALRAYKGCISTKVRNGLHQFVLAIRLSLFGR